MCNYALFKDNSLLNYPAVEEKPQILMEESRSYSDE